MAADRGRRSACSQPPPRCGPSKGADDTDPLYRQPPFRAAANVGRVMAVIAGKAECDLDHLWIALGQLLEERDADHEQEDSSSERQGRPRETRHDGAKETAADHQNGRCALTARS